VEEEKDKGELGDPGLLGVMNVKWK